MQDCNPLSTRLEIEKNLGPDVDGKKPTYRELIGCLLYLSVETQPVNLMTALTRLTGM